MTPEKLIGREGIGTPYQCHYYITWHTWVNVAVAAVPSPDYYSLLAGKDGQAVGWQVVDVAAVAVQRRNFLPLCRFWSDGEGESYRECMRGMQQQQKYFWCSRCVIFYVQRSFKDFCHMMIWYLKYSTKCNNKKVLSGHSKTWKLNLKIAWNIFF